MPEHPTLPRLVRLHRSLLPTPFHPLTALSEYLGVSVWCKRDDLTGFGFGGNKTRKLDFLIADAVACGATDIIATGGVQSNFCRMAAAYAARERLACHLVLGGAGAAESRSGNLVLDSLFGARMQLVASDVWDEWEAQASALAQRLRNDDRVPYRMPIGGSTPVGAMGYVHGMLELLDDAEHARIRPDMIMHASSSGGTQAGLVVGAAAAQWSGRVHGVSVVPTVVALERDIRHLTTQLSEMTGVSADEDRIVVDARWAGEAYALPTREAREAQSLFARMEGMVLDDVYTAKAAAALVGMCRSGELGAGDVVVFLHTGGSPHIFAGTP